jgi:hypothetical protein
MQDPENGFPTLFDREKTTINYKNLTSPPKIGFDSGPMFQHLSGHIALPATPGSKEFS